MQLGAQGIERRVEGLAQPGNVEVPEGLGRSVQRDQLITEAAMLEAVVQVEFAGGETLAELSVNPEFIAVSPQAGRVAVIIGVEQMWAQPLGYGVPGDFVVGPLGKALLTGEDALHPGQGREPGIAGRRGRGVERHGERTQMFFVPCRRAIDRLPAEFQLTDRLFAQAPAGGEQRLLRQDRKGLVADSAARRGVVDRLIDVEQKHTADLRVGTLSGLRNTVEPSLGWKY